MANNYLKLYRIKCTSFFTTILKQPIIVVLACCLLVSVNGFGQCNSETPTPFILDNFDNLSVSTKTTGLCLVGCGIFNANRLIDSDLTNSASASFGVLGVGTTHALRVTDGNTTYAQGTFAGFKIAPTSGLLNLSLLDAVAVKTYKNNILVESVSGSSLLGLSVLNSSTDYIIGFNSSAPFDAIEIVLNSGVAALNSISIYHAVVRQYCAGSALDCNTVTKVNLPVFPVAIDQLQTGFSGVSVGSITNPEHAVSSSATDFASINLLTGVLASANFAIKDQVTDYPAGTYAGMEIENLALLNSGALSNISLATYLNGTFQEQFSGSNLVASVSLISSQGAIKLGFVTTKSFDEVKLTLSQAAGLNLGTTKVYGAIFEKFCAGPALPCNVQTALIAPVYPVYVNNARSGIDGVVCALCTVTNTNNLIDSDLTNFEQINLTAAIGASGSLSVKEEITDYPAGTFAGYSIETPTFLNVSALDAITIRTYLNGLLQETKSGNGPLVSVGTDLLVGSTRQTIGFVSTKSFDEVRITVINTLAVNLGSVKVYNAVFQNLCAPTVACNTSYVLSNPMFPVIIDSDKTGIEGVA